MTGIVIGSTGAWGADVAHASTHQKTATYSCSVPGMGSESGTETLVISSADPDSVRVDEPTPTTHFTVTSQVPSSTVEGMRTYYGIDSVSVNGEGSVTVTAPHKDIHLTLPFTVPPTKLPASGSLTLVATGSFPSLTFTRPGVAKITMGGSTDHITALDASGNPAAFGTESETCTPASGQNVLIESIRVDPAPTTQPTAPTTAAAPTTASAQNDPVPGPPTPSFPTGNSGLVTQPQSSATTPTATPTNHASPEINGRTIGIVAAAAVGMAGLGGLSAWLAAVIRQHRHR